MWEQAPTHVETSLGSLNVESAGGLQRLFVGKVRTLLQAAIEETVKRNLQLIVEGNLYEPREKKYLSTLTEQDYQTRICCRQRHCHCT